MGNDDDQAAGAPPAGDKDDADARQSMPPRRHTAAPSEGAAIGPGGADTASSPPISVHPARGSVPESLSRLERDVAAKRAAAPVDRASRPGAAPVPATGPAPSPLAAAASLSQLERDVLAKAAAAPAHGAASLSRMEQDVLAKAAGAAPHGAAVRPGAVAVAATDPVGTTSADQPPSVGAPERSASGPSSLSALERDVTTKTRARQERNVGASAGSHPVGMEDMNRFEQDVIAKACATKQGSSDRPGAVSVAGAVSLAALERDIASKLQRSQEDTHTTDPQALAVDEYRRTAIANPPGAAAVSGPMSLAALERDIAAKTRGSHQETGVTDANLHASATDCAEARPGIVSMVGMSSLEALERDVTIKSKSGAPETPQSSAVRLASSEHGVAVIPNASLSTDTVDQVGLSSIKDQSGDADEMGETRDTFERSHRQNEKILSDQAHTNGPTANMASARNRLEQDTLLKHSVSRDLAPVHSNAAGVVGVSGAASLQQLEADVQMKQVCSSQLNEPLNRLEADVVAKAGVGKSMNDLSLMESEILQKTQGVGVNARVAPSLLDLSHSDSGQVTMREPDLLSSMRALEHQILTKPVAPQADQPQTSANSLQRYGGPSSFTVSPVVAPNTSVDPDIVYQSRVVPAVPAEGIQAFIADNVVDATGVAVIASEEDEEKKEWTRQKRVFCFTGLPLVVFIILVVVVPVVVVLGRKNQGTTMPSQSPTLAPTMAPTSSSLVSLIQQLSSISGEEAFASRDSPQFMAAQWLADDDTYDIDMSTSDPKFLQRYALAVIYFALGGPYWKACGQGDEVCTGDTAINSWLSSTDDCSWYGLTCGTSGLLEEFYFRAASGTETSERDFTMLDGELPYEIALLTKLIEFVADGFQLRGAVSDTFSKSPDLQTLIISNNNITGEFPPNLPDENPGLQVISFEGNQMTGAIPSSIGRLSNLTFLQLRGNDLSGPIESETFAFTSSLQRLELQNNRFSGIFPESGYSLTDLEILRLDDTGLQGSIGSDIGSMSNLRELDMSGSQLGGSIPGELYRLESLVSLNLYGASFTGTLSNNIALLNQTLQYVYLADNDFTGPIPVDGLGALSNLLELELYGNRLTGAITSDSALCGLVFASQIQYIRTDCSVTCECCAKCIPDR